MPVTKIALLKDDDHVRALVKLTKHAESYGSVYRDAGRRHLLLRIGKRQVSFYFFSERMLRGKRTTTSKLLGHWPGLSATAASREADKIAGRVSAGRAEPGRKSAVRFAEALERYVLHLRKKAADKGKTDTWAKLVTGKGAKHLLPEWGRWTLAEMSNSPDAVADFHARLTIEAGPVAANHCARVIRAVYRHAMRTNRGLPYALPTSGVDFNVEQRREVASRDLKAWAKAWNVIPNANRRAFHLLNLLGGFRPGELARLKWGDVVPCERVVIIRNAKAGLDIRVPMSAPIARALQMARDGATESGPKPQGSHEFVFPARGPRGHIIRFDSDALPFYANALRHTWRTIAADCGVDDTLAHLMLGHAPRGVSQGYLSRMVLSSWPAMRSAQRSISRRIVSLLGINALMNGERIKREH
jgi:integrase